MLSSNARKSFGGIAQLVDRQKARFRCVRTCGVGALPNVDVSYGIREILQMHVTLPSKGFVRIHRTINRLFISNELAILEAECFYVI